MTPVLPVHHNSNILERLKKQGGHKIEDINYLQLIIVRLGEMRFALDALSIVEVTMAPPLIETAPVAPFLCGVVNIRGNVIPVFDPAPRLNLGSNAEKVDKVDDLRLVVFKTNEGMLSMLVDDIELRLFEGRIQPHPPANAAITPFCKRLAEVDEEIVPLLELDVIFTPEELKALVDVKNLF